MTNWLSIALDDTLCPSLRRGGFLDVPHACVEPYATRPLVGAGLHTIGSVEYLRMVVQRPLWVRWLLTQGYSVLQCDVDVVMLRNPLPYLASAAALAAPRRCNNPANLNSSRRAALPCPHHNSTLLLQSELSYGYNAGFYLVRPSESSVAFFDSWMQEMVQPTKESAVQEQHAMFFTLGNIGSRAAKHWMARGMQLVKLQETEFPVGKVWYELWDSPTHGTDKARAYVLHINWVKSSDIKKWRLKRDHLWFLDGTDETCAVDFDPLERACQRRCAAHVSCELGRPCPEASCWQLTQWALFDLAKSVVFNHSVTCKSKGPRRKICETKAVEDRWHPMAFERACGPAAPPEPAELARVLPEVASRALGRAAALLRAGASVHEIFALPHLLDDYGGRPAGVANPKAKAVFSALRRRLGLR